MDSERMIFPVDIKDRQIFILKLLNHVVEPVMYKEIEDIGKDFRIEEHLESFSKPEVVKVFVNMVKVGVLPRGEVFTIHIDRQLNEVVTMFHVLFYAKDFATFMKVACWMRLYLNEGMFVYALTVAVRHRVDCRGIILPPPYEIYPYYFVRADVIQKAYIVKMKKGLVDPKLCDFYGIKRTDKGVIVIDENFYDCRDCINDEVKLRYFTEDIDLNTYYYYFHVDFPFWMKDEVSDKYKVRKYELTTYIYQQILARHYLERLSNGLGEVSSVSLIKPIKNGVIPWIQLHNGVILRSRMNNYVVVRDETVDVVRVVKEIENIIIEAIVKGFIEINGVRYELTKPEDIEVLGKIIYGAVEKIGVDRVHVDSYRYLLILMKAVVGLDVVKSDKYFVIPTVLDSYQTALRDPVFYQIQKRLVNLVLIFKRRLPSYTREELYFPGVKIDNVVVDKLVTFFDYYNMDITNAVRLTDEEIKKASSDVIVNVRKRRLNHQPFRVTVDVVSDKAVDCIVKVFIGPKYDHVGRVIDINVNRVNFVEIDTFVYRLITGKNTIVRNSRDMHNMVHDRVMTRDWWKKVEAVNDVRQLLVGELKNFHTGFPTRLLIPKGHVGGMKMMLYVVVVPVKPVDNIDVSVVDPQRNVMVDFWSTVLLDKRALGFPLDRHIDITKFFTPNMKFVDVIIFHKRQVCDMKTRWERWVLKNYDMVEFSTVEGQTYFVDSDVTNQVISGVNIDV